MNKAKQINKNNTDEFGQRIQPEEKLGELGTENCLQPELQAAGAA